MFLDKWIVGDDKIIGFSWVFLIAVVIGAWKILWWILMPMLLCLGHCCRCKQNLKARYGREDNSAYAVVTGGSDGIGLELCNQLAEHGFNICMISRNISKVDTKL